MIKLVNIKKLALFSLPILLLTPEAQSQSKLTEDIRLNQVGFYPSGPKTAVVVDAPSDKFYVIKENLKDTVFTGQLTPSVIWEHSKENVSKADFSKFKTPGSYRVFVPKLGYSFPFEIKDQVLLPVAKGSIRGYYYQRASIDLTPEHAGKWARPAGHPDNKVMVHGSAATATRPEKFEISSTRGWYDAGDYNKYIVNSGISTYTLLSIYEQFPKFADTVKLNIPESKNNVPDLLDEILWNVRWMLTMQDEDGGVYHKLTNPSFDGYIMPADAKAPRYVVQKGTAASLDFAAVTAQAARVFAKYKKEFPGLSDSLKNAAVKAYAWAKKNPNIEYRQTSLNQKFQPGIRTGEYGDTKFEDEFQWAAIELFVTTGKGAYFEESKLEYSLAQTPSIPDWASVSTLGLYTIAQNKSKLAEFENINPDVITGKIVSLANKYKENAEKSAYGTAMGTSGGDFRWGSNSIAANQGVLLIQAYLLTKDKSYLDAAQSNMDYLLGRNATAYCFLTGFGSKKVMHPHTRPSEADGIEDPVPGLLAGGPNPGQEDKADCPGSVYTSTAHAKSYIDHKCSYASNEIAINWNAPFVYLSFALEALRGK